MFLGHFQHNLDDKGRLMIPARFRELLAAGAFITQGFDKCLMVMTDVYFKEVYDRISAMNLADPTARLRVSPRSGSGVECHVRRNIF